MLDVHICTSILLTLLDLLRSASDSVWFSIPSALLQVRDCDLQPDLSDLRHPYDSWFTLGLHQLLDDGNVFRVP